MLFKTRGFVTGTEEPAAQCKVALENNALRAQSTDFSVINLLTTSPFCHDRIPMADQKDRDLWKPDWSDIC